MKRLLLFLKLTKDNKYFYSGKYIKIDLYVPGFPSKAFYTACDKFKVFNKKLPCTTVLISVTSACKFSCPHCYQRLDKGKDADINILTKTVRKLQDNGIAFFNIEGGDPFLTYDRLLKICENIDDRSEVWINSTGEGITKERLKELKKLNIKSIMFSLHETEPQSFNKFMGKDNAWEIMQNGIRLCHEQDIDVSINSCIGKNDIYSGKLERVIKLAGSLKASVVQLIIPKPTGGLLGGDLELYSEKDLLLLKQKVNLYNKKFKDAPSLSCQAVEEDKDHFGCTAGGTDRFYINAKGDMQPCEFLNISFGNIVTDDFDAVYDKMRSVFETPDTGLKCEIFSGAVNDYYKKHKLQSLPVPYDGIKNEIKDVLNDLSNRDKTLFYNIMEKIKP